ncbi:Crp/Fnr family transcriptional regulator [Puia dinghuensis]|nr:Crp/Fnr family transcriptional regulator [Puia dinghuensis]
MDSTIFEIFKKYTRRYVKLTDEELARIESVCTYKKLRKQQYLLQEGDVWKLHAFIVRGCLRTYSIDEQGKEHIVGFGVNNWWVGDRESLKSGKPSKFNIDAVIKSEVILIRDRDFTRLLKEIPAFNEMISTILDRSFMAAQQRILSFISHCAEERYLAFLEVYPGFAACIPKNMIASFLGITRETLSRVRKSAASK